MNVAASWLPKNSFWMHCMIFILFQFLFIYLDGAKIWKWFQLNPLGEWLYTKLDMLFRLFQFYVSPELNRISLVWIIVLFIHLFITIGRSLLQRKK
ncbi:hypothetical protein DX933_03530 [Ornithinibacillus gellani]|uniref:hypothetical protein n=1 Tax=Ornithinibacillus gellani TaxID=2293253 RepID=UPI000F464123|nr:hypothetical protein [Ornithinibacillus gellani]TQS76001.1 hypothetical protein DX933_03530 [Ornithinibacillus gellani]